MTFEAVLNARLLDGRRKTHQPAGARLAEFDFEADGLRQRINRAYLMDWSDEAVRSRLHRVACDAIPGAIALMVDDTGIEKSGSKSPGVYRQYTGTAGKTTNCQVIVSTHLASHTTSAPLEMDLYLPETWCDDAERRVEAGIPEDVEFKKKPQLALEQIAKALERGGVPKLVLADAGYGDGAGFRSGLTALGCQYAVGISSDVMIWRPGEGPDPPRERSSTRGPRPTRRFPGVHQPVTVADFAREVPAESWGHIALRPMKKEPPVSRFSAHRIRTARGARRGKLPGPEEWLLIQWPEGADAPSHYFLLTLPADTGLEKLARVAKLRWRVERDYRNMKQEVGFTHYEGRRWVGFNHHLTISMAAITYMVAVQALFPPEDPPIAGRGGTPTPTPSGRAARSLPLL